MIDPYRSVELRSVRQGDEFYECDGGECIAIRALTDATRNKKGWTFLGKTADGRSLDFFTAHGSHPYGPKFYAKPPYARVTEFAASQKKEVA